MKNPLNKARIPENKAHEPLGKTAGPVLTDPDLQTEKRDELYEAIKLGRF